MNNEYLDHFFGKGTKGTYSNYVWDGNKENMNFNEGDKVKSNKLIGGVIKGQDMIPAGAEGIVKDVVRMQSATSVAVQFDCCENTKWFMFSPATPVEASIEKI